MGVLMESDARPGSSGSVAEARDENPASVGSECLIFLHPKCPCSRDTLLALARIESREPGLRVRIVFVGPADADEEWWSGRNWDLAKLVPGAVVQRDAGGDAARATGVRTSGHMLLYDAGGRLRFSGGLAPLRDESPFGLATGVPDSERTTCIRRPVRGCPLFDE